VVVTPARHRAVLAAIFRQILDGERDPGLGTRLDDPTWRAVVAMVLEHIEG
jgi:hypothetical protein